MSLRHGVCLTLILLSVAVGVILLDMPEPVIILTGAIAFLMGLYCFCGERCRPNHDKTDDPSDRPE